jgi:hypothetical protein
VILIASISGCGIYESKIAPSPQNTITQNDELTALLNDPKNAITYQNVNRFILNDSCIRCHNPTTSKGDVVLTTFDDVRASLYGIEEQVLNVKKMPPKKPLSENLQRLLKRWIEQGANE